jgi:hypothetical protein
LILLLEEEVIGIPELKETPDDNGAENNCGSRVIFIV